VADGELTLTEDAAEGVGVLARAAERGDPAHYGFVQGLLLTQTPKHGPDDGPEVDQVSQVPLPLADREAGG
jgi:hypothetical protein